jgi:hypothetical protein
VLANKAKAVATLSKQGPSAMLADALHELATQHRKVFGDIGRRQRGALALSQAMEIRNQLNASKTRGKKRKVRVYIESY